MSVESGLMSGIHADDNSTSHSSTEDADITRPTKRARVATRANPPRKRKPTAKQKQTEDNAMDALEKRLARVEKAASKKDQEIARLKADLEDRGENRRARFPNGSPGNSDVESEDDIGGNAADSIELVRQYTSAGSGQQRRLRREGSNRHQSRQLTTPPNESPELPDNASDSGVNLRSRSSSITLGTFPPRQPSLLTTPHIPGLRQQDELTLPSDNESQSRDPAQTPAINPRILRSLPLPPWAHGKEPAKNSKAKASDWEKQVEDRVLGASYRYEVKILTEDPFPDIEKQTRWSEEVWIAEFNSQPQWALTDRIRSYLLARGSHGRGEVKKAAAVVVPLHYGFRATSESTDANAALHLELMTRSAFVYKDPGNRTGVMQHPAIEAVAREAWFKNRQGFGVSSNLSDAFSPISLASLALIRTALFCAISEWSSGSHKQIQFREETYKKEYGKQLKDVEEWHGVDPGLFTKDRQQIHDNLRAQLGLSKKELAPTADMDDADRLQAIAEARERRGRAPDNGADATGTSS